MKMPSHPLKIAVVIPKFGLIGGAEGFVAEITRRIASDPRYDVHVFSRKWTSGFKGITFHKIRVISFPKFLTTISFAWFVKRALAGMNFQVIHAHDRIFSADVFTMHGIPHRLWVQEIRRKAMSLYDYVTARVEGSLVKKGRCRHFLAVSHLVKEKFLQTYNKINPERVQVVHPGVDAARYRMLDRKLCRREIRERYGVGPDDVVILFVSMNFHIKGLDRLIEALAVLKSQRHREKFKLLVVGKGNTRKYTALAGKLNVVENIVFTGPLQKNELERTYLAGDLFSILSRFDTFGMVVLEAMAASLPVVISSTVGAKDLVRNGINGFIVNGEAGASAISEKIDLLFDEERRLQMGQQARTTALACTWEETAKKMTAVYEMILDNQRDKSSLQGIS